MVLLDKYFIRPLFWDYILVIIIAILTYLAISYGYLDIPKKELVIAMTSDLSTVGLTIAGFILTLFTILITLKSGIKYEVKNKNILDQFLGTEELYSLTIFHLKNCIKSLLFVSILGYALRLIFQESSTIILFIYNYVALVILAITLWRCLLILSKIVDKPRHVDNGKKW